MLYTELTASAQASFAGLDVATRDAELVLISVQ